MIPTIVHMHLYSSSFVSININQIEMKVNVRVYLIQSFTATYISILDNYNMK